MKKLSIIILTIILAASLAFAVPPSPPFSGQPADTELTAIADLANGAGALTNDGSGNFSYVSDDGNATIITQSATGNVTAAQMRGQTHVVTGAYTLSLPTAVVGYRGRFVASTAAVFSIDVVTGTDVIILNGTALTAGYKATTDGTINAEVYVECRVAGKYHIISIIGLAVDGGA